MLFKTKLSEFQQNVGGGGGREGVIIPTQNGSVDDGFLFLLLTSYVTSFRNKRCFGIFIWYIFLARCDMDSGFFMRRTKRVSTRKSNVTL